MSYMSLYDIIKKIAVWLIPEKIDEIEAMAMSTAAQVKYRVIMTNLMSWMKETTNSKTIHPTVMSSIENSQKGPITQIIWLASHNKLDENGRIVELEANSKAEELGWQFVTSSKDGTVAFWDLRSATPFYRTPQLIFQNLLAHFILFYFLKLFLYSFSLLTSWSSHKTLSFVSLSTIARITLLFIFKLQFTAVIEE